jgi:hypothetical protein
VSDVNDTPETHETGIVSDEEAAELNLEIFDLDHDGEVSATEDMRARLGLVDARLEEIAGEGGIKGKLAEGAHHLLDKLDND